MPRRTNDFQTLVAILEHQLAPAGAVVTESKMVPDRATGLKREVDIYIEYSVGHHPVTIGVECVDKSRPADIFWVQGMVLKHQELGTSQLVLVSREGFTRAAREKAEQHGARAITLRQAESFNWQGLDPPLEVELVEIELSFPYETRLDVLVATGTPAPEQGGTDLLEQVIKDADGTPLGRVVDLITGRVKDQIAEANSRSAGEVVAAFNVQVDLPPGAFWERVGGTRYFPMAFRCFGRCLIVSKPVPMTAMKYGDREARTGAFDVGGRRVLLSRIDEPTRVSIGFSFGPGLTPLLVEATQGDSLGGGPSSGGTRRE